MSVIIGECVFTVFPNGWRVEPMKMASRRRDVSQIPVISLDAGVVIDRKLLMEIMQQLNPPQQHSHQQQ